VKNTYTPKCHLFANKVNVEHDVLGPAMMNGVGGEVDSEDVVAVQDGDLIHGVGELEKKLTKPRALGNGVGHNTILSLGTGARDSGYRLDDQEMSDVPR
jgi:hypothetical protein